MISFTDYINILNLCARMEELSTLRSYLQIIKCVSQIMVLLIQLQIGFRSQQGIWVLILQYCNSIGTVLNLEVMGNV